MAKAPFERVFSLIERKKLLKRVAADKTKIHIKSARNEVLEFKVQGLDEGFNLEGKIFGSQPRDFEKVTALFYIEKDKYFLTTRLKQKGDSWVLLNDTNLYKLNRRTAFRVQVPTTMEMVLFITSIRNIEINKNVSVIEFSSGGARVHWYNDRKLSPGTPLKGVLQWGKGKVLPIDAVIMHSPAPGVFGLRFINLTNITMNRLKLLSLEVQQSLHFS
jgi:hypothetical protein